MKKLVLVVSSIVLSGSVYASGLVDTSLSAGEGNTVYEDFPSLFADDHVAKSNEATRAVSPPEIGDSSGSYWDEIMQIDNP